MSTIVGGKFAEKVASKLNLEYYPIERREYPDSEVCPRIQMQDSFHEQAFLILRVRQEQNLNSYLIEFLLALNNLKKYVEKIHAIMPYMVYARQDAVFRKGEPFSSKILAGLLEKSGCTTFTACNTHSHRTSLKELFSIKSYNLSVIPRLAKYVKTSYHLQSPFLLGPDDESIHWVKEFARKLDIDDYEIIHKERDFETGEISTKTPEIDLDGREVIIVDDIIATGNTMVLAIKNARKMGAKFVIACTVHPVLAENALERLKTLGIKELYASNTLPSSISKVDVTPLIAQKVKEINREYE